METSNTILVNKIDTSEHEEFLNDSEFDITDIQVGGAKKKVDKLTNNNVVGNNDGNNGGNNGGNNSGNNGGNNGGNNQEKNEKKTNNEEIINNLGNNVTPKGSNDNTGGITKDTGDDTGDTDDTDEGDDTNDGDTGDDTDDDTDDGDTDKIDEETVEKKNENTMNQNNNNINNFKNMLNNSLNNKKKMNNMNRIINNNNSIKKKSKKKELMKNKKTKKMKPVPITLDNLSRHFESQRDEEMMKNVIDIKKHKKGGINILGFKLKYQKELQKLKNMEKSNHKQFLELRHEVEQSKFSHLIGKDIVKALHSFVSEKEFEKFVIKKMLMDGHVKLNF